jgi:phospholipase C
MDGLNEGDQLIARVYNAIRNSPVWLNSLFIVLYDEHGGF